MAFLTQAFFILFAHDIARLRTNVSSGCGGMDCALYDTFVVQPLNVTSSDVSFLRSVGKRRPDFKPPVVLAYFDTNHIPIRSGCAKGHSMGDHPGKTCEEYGQCGDGPYLQGLRKIFKSSLFENRYVANNSAVCTYPGLADFILCNESVSVLVPYLADVSQKAGFDGWYLDNYLNDVKWAQGGIASTFSNGEVWAGGVKTSCGTSYAAAVEQYESWHPVLAAGLRTQLGDAAILIGNSAGAATDSSLNGLTLEMEACADPGSTVCIEAALAQSYVGAKPSFGVFWLTHAETMPPAIQCKRVAEMQRKLPWMRAGTDFIDLSHITCNETNDG